MPKEEETTKPSCSRAPAPAPSPPPAAAAPPPSVEGRASAAWDAQYEKLRAFYQKNNHSNVPRKGDTAPLAKWLGKQRGERRSKLSPEQVEKLKAVQFEWNSKSVLDDLAWNERYQRLQQFQQQHGHTDVPQKYKEDPELGTWVANQRRRYNQNTLRQDRTDLLNALTFNWLIKGGAKHAKISTSAYDTQWNAMYERLKQYKERHGHCNVSQNAEGDLGMWVSTQRRYFHKKTWVPGKGMRQDRKDKLDAIGFEWNRLQTKKRASDNINNNNYQDENEQPTKKWKEDETSAGVEPASVIEAASDVDKEASVAESTSDLQEAEKEVANVVETVIASVEQQETETQGTETQEAPGTGADTKVDVKAENQVAV